MKRKLLSFVLVLATLLTCAFSTTIVSSAEAGDETPVVTFYGHQRTVVADSTYGIRLIALVNDLSPDAVGFDIALIKNDGTMMTATKEIDTVYSGINAKVNGVDTVITAQELGGNYIYTLVIADVPADQGFIGYLCSAYYVVNGEKVSGETKKIVYKGSDLYATEKLQRVFPDFVDAGGYGWEHSKNNNEYMWDGIVSNNNDDYTGIKDPGAWSYAKFEQPTVIGKITLVSGGWYQTWNDNLQIEGSIDGETWNLLETVTNETAPGFVPTGSSVNETVATFVINDTTAYNYIRLKACATGTDKGISINEVEVYAKVFVSGEFKEVNTTNPTHTTITDDFTTYKLLDGQLIDAQSPKRDQLKLMWDNTVDNTYGGVWRVNDDLDEAFSMAALSSPTVIQKITVTAAYNADMNQYAKIQVSVDGSTWVTVHEFLPVCSNNTAYTKENNDFLISGWHPGNTMSFYVFDNNQYNYIRIIGDSISMAEIQVFGSSVSYSAEFAEKLNTVLPIAE